ncbi:helicase associated domain-containing protein [Streptomyces massasporeus]
MPSSACASLSAAVSPRASERLAGLSSRRPGSCPSRRPRSVAAKQYNEREGHLRVPRKHVERIVIGDDGDGDSGGDREEREIKLGAWVGNQRSRAAALSPERNSSPPSACAGREVVTVAAALAADYPLGGLRPGPRLDDWAPDQARFARQ